MYILFLKAGRILPLYVNMRRRERLESIVDGQVKGKGVGDVGDTLLFGLVRKFPGFALSSFW
jgi:hypothetical protein